MLAPKQKAPAERHNHALSKGQQMAILGAVGVVLFAAIALPKSTDNLYVCPATSEQPVICHSFNGQNCNHPYVNNDEIAFTQLPCATQWIKLKDYTKNPKQQKKAKPSKTQSHKQSNR